MKFQYKTNYSTQIGDKTEKLNTFWSCNGFVWGQKGKQIHNGAVEEYPSDNLLDSASNWMVSLENVTV